MCVCVGGEVRWGECVELCGSGRGPAGISIACAKPQLARGIPAQEPGAVHSTALIPGVGLGWSVSRRGSHVWSERPED